MRLLLAATALTTATLAAHAEAPFAFDRTPGDLPKSVVPSAYTIDLVPDLKTLDLKGHEAVTIEVRQPTDKIVLNQIGLTLSHARLESGGEATATNDDKAQTVTLRFPAEIKPGRHTLTLDYAGKIPETPAGLYYDDYKDPKGAQKRMLVTQFEVADARRMFPGWDEPAFKATFRLSAVLPSDFTAVSNMPIEGKNPAGPGLSRVQFKTSPRMSTYLLAMIAGDMGSLSSQAAGVAMHAYAPTGEEQQGQYALDVETKVLPYYNEYFGTAFPLPKLDLIAIPGNYEAGAMENWGAITFVDSTMLFDPKTSDAATRETIHVDVAHEMAHQWSGDLVTMGWWDNIWLNEGFATWMEYKATDHFNPDWQVWPRQHAAREQAMASDAVPSTHPIQQTIHDVSEANSAFDQISYQKGEQIIRMIEDWIGPDTFRTGMRAYMKAHAYGNATSADLWAALGAAAHKDVGAVAATFTEQPGIPLIHVTRDCAGPAKKIHLEQDRFTINDPHPKALRWKVPVTLGTPDGKTVHLLLDGARDIPVPSCDFPAKLNFGEDGYYRSEYDQASLAPIAARFTQFGAADRVNLLGDQFALFESGREKLATYLDLLPHLKGETNVAVWEDTLGHLRALDRLTHGSPTRETFRVYARSLVRPEFDRLGWDAKPGESFLDALLRPQLIRTLGQFADPQITDEAHRRFEAFVKNPDSLAPNLREPVLNIVGHHADETTWNQLREMGEHAVSTEEKTRYFGAMAQAEDPRLIAKTIKYTEGDQVPSNIVLQVIFMASQNSDNPDEVWHQTVQEQNAIRQRLAALTRDILLPAGAIGSSNPAVATALQNDPASSASIGAKIWTARALDAIQTQVDLKSRAAPALDAWLAQHHAS